MPQWLSISLGVVLGIAVVFGAIYLAIRPYVQARPPKRVLPEPLEDTRDYYQYGGMDRDGGLEGDGSGHNI